MVRAANCTVVPLDSTLSLLSLALLRRQAH